MNVWKPGEMDAFIRAQLKDARSRRIEPVSVCQLCLQPSVRSVCDGCESTGGLFSDWRSDSDG